MKKIYTVVTALCLTVAINAQTLIYSNNFNNGAGTATIVGSGTIKDTTNFGKVFHNAAKGQAIRKNYLLLPSDIFTTLQSSGSKELSIAFWVNKGTATDNFFTPLFSAYGAAPVNEKNTFPMMILQSRLLTQVNCSGWNDFGDADNTNKKDSISTAWLDDAAWHYYTATFTETSAKIYIDGNLANAWTYNGSDGHTVAGLFTNGSDLKYICLGGNQAWDWGDVDAAYMYDDIAIYSNALTVAQIKANIAAKQAEITPTTTDINQPTANSLISVYPNPATNYITVTGFSGKAKVAIINLNGITLSTNDVAANENISLNNLAQGSYLVKVIASNSVFVKKIIIK